MGTAVAYDKWEDVGASFTEDEISGWVPAAVAEARIAWLCAQALIVERYLSVPGASAPEWWKKVQAKMLDTATWYAQVGEVAGIDRGACLSLPAPSSAEGKVLTVGAQKLPSPSVFVSEWSSLLAICMRDFVTRARRSSAWSRAQKKKGNRIANAIVKEMSVCALVADLAQSLSS